MVDWTLQVGSEVTRADVKDAYGGAPYGGIVPIKTRSRNVLIYSDREEGSKYGYNFDGWATTADVFFYTGHGPLGDQTMKAGNAAILSHKKDRRPLRVFEYTGKVVQGTSTKIHRHVGEFEIDESDPYRRTDSPDENGDLRTVIVFRLLPIGDHERSQSDESEAQFSDQPSATLVDLESADVDTFEQTRSAESTEAVRRESQLVSEFETHLHALGHDTARLRLTSRSTSHPMFTDIYDVTNNTLHEAKSSASRMSIRLAIGQLLDYARYLRDRDPQLAVLVPVEPDADMLDLLNDLGIRCVFPDRDGFRYATRS